jgi:hypothetical protein
MGRPWDAYRFSDGTTKQVEALVREARLPWFTASTWRYALLRPLPSLMLSLERKWFRDWRLGYQLHSMLWYITSILAFSLVLRRLVPRLSGLGTVIFAINPTNLEAVTWLSARHALIANSLCLFSFCSYLKQDLYSKCHRYLFLALFVLALAVSEVSLQFVPYFMMSEMLAWRSGKRRYFVFATMPGLVLIYLLLYVSLGRGVRGASSYSSFVDGGLGQLVVRSSEMLIRIFTNIVGGWMDEKPLAFGLLLLVTICAYVQTLGTAEEESRAMRTLALSSFLAALPVVGGTLGGRIAMACSLGVVTSLTSLILSPSNKNEALVSRRVRLFMAGVGVTVSLLWLARFHVMAGRISQQAAAQARALDAPEIASCSNVFIVGESSWLVGQLGWLHRRWSGTGVPRTWSWLSGASPQKISRISDRAIEIRALGGRLLDMSFFRDAISEPLPKSWTRIQKEWVVEVADSGEGTPITVRLSFSRPIEDENVVILRPHRGELVPLPTLGVGEAILVNVPGASRRQQ